MFSVCLETPLSEPGIMLMVIDPHLLARTAAASGEDSMLRLTWGSWRKLGTSLIRLESLHNG